MRHIRFRPGFVATATAVLILAPRPALAQADHEFETDRPDFTEGTRSVAGGHTQLEAGYTYTRLDDDASEHTLGELLIRIGLGHDAELRVGLDSYAWLRGSAGPRSGRTDTSLGVKLNLDDGEFASLRPAIAVIAGTSLPTGDAAFGESGAQPEALLALAWTPADRFGIGSNFSYLYGKDGTDRFHRLATSIAVDYDWTDRIGTYLEGYGFVPRGIARDDVVYINGGMTYLLSPLFQIDTRVGLRLSGVRDRFVGLGFSYRW